MGLRVGEVVQVPPLLKKGKAQKVCLKQAMQVVRDHGQYKWTVDDIFFHFMKEHAWILVKNLRFTCVTSAVYVSGGKLLAFQRGCPV